MNNSRLWKVTANAKHAVIATYQCILVLQSCPSMHWRCGCSTNPALRADGFLLGLGWLVGFVILLLLFAEQRLYFAQVG